MDGNRKKWGETQSGKEENTMNTAIKELNIEEMEMVNGGINWGRVFGVG